MIRLFYRCELVPVAGLEDFVAIARHTELRVVPA